MGQKQSSSAGVPEEQPSAPRKDFYELLGLETTATPEEIKKAYRKKALELHPDKNYGNIEEATTLFAEVQSAYEILSDPQERAWYDSHRHAILSGGDGTHGPETPQDSRFMSADEVMSLIVHFNPRMEFSDNPSGFFGGLRETFDQLSTEESIACRWDNLDPIFYPGFGHKDDSSEVVRSFYSMWSGFSTKKSYSWKDVYKYSEAPDRRVRRLMEKENKRIRDEAIREFNDAVRSLVAFARKRDPRYQANVQSEAERQKILRESAAAQAARSRQANKAKMQDFTLPEWAQTEEPEEEYFLSSEEEPEPQAYFECVICNKTFKSEKQVEAHERSKKHIKALKQLQREMKLEDINLDLESSTPENPQEYTLENERIDESDSNIDLDSSVQDKDTNTIESSEILHDIGMPSEHPADQELETSPSHEQVSSLATDDSDDNSEEDIRKHALHVSNSSLPSDQQADPDVDLLDDQLRETSITNEEPSPEVRKLGKAKQKRAKKAAQMAASETSTFVCAACQESFSSRTKLFTHVRELDHAQPPGTKQRGQQAAKKKSRK
ncbi:hypothetical protein FQN57_002171 [Myotisia sp. PD_48]|nr:hypothetical protein FQN57_002171 [Myotisia sp. PD_48]